jgi:hypothetical protein
MYMSLAGQELCKQRVRCLSLAVEGEIQRAPVMSPASAIAEPSL